MQTEGGRGSKKETNLVNEVCERPRTIFDNDGLIFSPSMLHTYIAQTELKLHYPCLGIFGHGSNGTPSLMTLTLAKGFRILLHSLHKGKWMFILIMLVLYLAQNSSH